MAQFDRLCVDLRDSHGQAQTTWLAVNQKKRASYLRIEFRMHINPRVAFPHDAEAAIDVGSPAGHGVLLSSDTIHVFLIILCLMSRAGDTCLVICCSNPKLRYIIYVESLLE